MTNTHCTCTTLFALTLLPTKITMIPRSRTTAGNGSPRRRNTLSLAGLGALLTVVGPRSLVVQSFVVPRGVTRFDASAAAAGFCVASLPNRAATINTIDTSISHNKRYSGRSDRLLLRQTWAVRGFVKTALGASLDDDTKDNFDPVSKASLQQQQQ